MIKQNKKMLQIKEKFEDTLYDYPKLVKKILKIGIIEINKCIILSDEPVIISEKDFGRVLKMYGDKTGYEAANNEIRVVDYFANEGSLTEERQYMLGQIIIEILSDKIMTKFEVDNICFILSFNEGILTLRFHVFRESEGVWIETDLETFEEPTEYIIR